VFNIRDNTGINGLSYNFFLFTIFNWFYKFKWACSRVDSHPECWWSWIPTPPRYSASISCL